MLCCRMVIVERLRLRRLRWGSATHVAALRQEFGSFDTVVGADVVYMEEAVPALFDSIAQLLEHSSKVR